MRKFEQTAELIRQNISVLVSQAEQQINVINSTGLAEAYKIKQFAKAEALNNTINTESEVYKKLNEEIKLNNNQLPEYLMLNGLMEQSNAKLLVGIQNSMINFGNQPVVS